MVPLTERRPRLRDEEIPEVIHGLKLRLMELVEKREEIEKAEIAYRCLTRLLEDKPGRPKYTNATWDSLSYFIDNGEDHINQRLNIITHRRREKSKQDEEQGAN